MLFKTIKREISNYPFPKLPCQVCCYLTQEKKDAEDACFWIGFDFPLTDLVGKTDEEINAMVKAEADRLIADPENQAIFEAIEFGVSIVAPEEV